MSKRLATIDTAVPIEFELESVRAREADPDALKLVYKDLEFHSLLKELGPSEDTRARDYQALESAAALAEWLRVRFPRMRPWRWRSRNRRGRVRPRHHRGTIGVAWNPAKRAPLRSPPASICALKPWLEDAARPKIACDVKSALLALDKLGIQGARLRSRHHAVRVPAGCRSLGLPAGGAGAAAARFEAGGGAGAARRYHAGDLQAAAAGGGRARPGKAVRGIELPLARVLARMERVACASTAPSWGGSRS
jgi:hypothetical protein